jgi:hypothetical protein
MLLRALPDKTVDVGMDKAQGTDTAPVCTL